MKSEGGRRQGGKRGAFSRTPTTLLMNRSASAPVGALGGAAAASRGDSLLRMRRLLDGAATSGAESVTFTGTTELMMLREMLKQFSVHQADALFAERLAASQSASSGGAAAAEFLHRTYSAAEKKADVRLLGSVRKTATRIAKRRNSLSAPGSKDISPLSSPRGDSDGPPIMPRLASTAATAAALSEISSNEADFVEETFRTFDADGSGFIDRGEVLAALNASREEGESFSEADITDMIASVDVDGDGQINRTEFLSLFRTSLRSCDDDVADFSTVDAVISHSFRVDADALHTIPSLDTATALFARVDEWDFDPFELRDCMESPLVFIGLAVFGQRDFGAELPLNRTKLVAFLRACDDGYKDVPYHCATHAADVTQSTHFLLKTAGLERHLSQTQVLAMLLAVVVHDLGHVGVNNAFLVHSRHELAIRYNDTSVLENMHIANAFSLIEHGEGNHDIFDRFEGAARNRVRKVSKCGLCIVCQSASVPAGVHAYSPNFSLSLLSLSYSAFQLMIALVVATDMAHHNTVMQSFKNEIHSSSQLERTASTAAREAAAQTGSIGYSADGSAPAASAPAKKLTTIETIDAMIAHTGLDTFPAINLALGDNALKTMKMFVHCADVSNACKPWDLYRRWTDCVRWCCCLFAPLVCFVLSLSRCSLSLSALSLSLSSSSSSCLHFLAALSRSPSLALSPNRP